MSAPSTTAAGDTGEEGTPRRDQSMELIARLMSDSLEEGYAVAAARRRASTGAGREPPERRAGVTLAVGLVAIGLLLATAAVQTRQRATTADEARSALVAEIEDRQRANNRLQRRLEDQRAAATRDRQAALQLTAQGAALADRLTRLETASGAGAVAGPGLVLTLSDAPEDDDAAATDPRADEETGDGRLTDRDLQTLVNELWAAGAEAVAVDGQRLTALSAIRAAGEAILVDFRPLVPPYRVQAVGPPDLRSRFVSGFAGSYLQVLQDYGIGYQIEDRDRLELPASAGIGLRYATTTGDVGSASGSRSATKEAQQ